EQALEDLKRRLASTRWPERETVGDWSQGVPLQKAQALIAYWRDMYDWRRFEARLNAFPQYRTQIDGLGIHFIHVRSSHRNALPHQRPQGLIAAHVNWQFVFPEKLPDNPTPAERRAIDRASWFANDQSGYFREHATRPQTIGYPLADSAAGQALWIYEKFQAWTDNHGNPEDALAVDAMLDNISLYWFTDTAAS